MLAGRVRLHEIVGPSNDFIFDATTAVCAGLGFTDSARGVFVNLAAYSDHVTLVFQWGVRLYDPERLLKGGGNQVRHLRLTCLDTLSDPAVLDLVRQSAAQYPAPPHGFKPQKFVKVYAGRKRRPSAIASGT